MQSSSGDAFGDRRKAMEDSFFRERDQVLLERMRLELESVEAHQHLAHVSGIVDEAVLKNLVQCGVRAETLAAVTLIPVVEVAWCDGAVSADERKAVLQAAAENGVAAGSAAHALLDRWLQDRPDLRIITTWKEYVGALAGAMTPDAVLVLRERTIDRCRRVAEAAGGFLGLTSKVSAVEQATIDEFERAFTPPR
ncbi:MAG: hypothetical protein WD872_09400 [Pirellulaceae bacterium]